MRLSERKKPVRTKARNGESSLVVSLTRFHSLVPQLPREPGTGYGEIDKRNNQRCFGFVLEENSNVFKFLRFEEHFRKVPFSVDIRRNRRNKAAFSKFSSVVLTVPKVK